jgi:hypothetical protein
MSIKIVLTPYKDPADGLDWHEQTPIIKKELNEYLSSYSEGKIEYNILETDHGIGADFPTITLEIIKIAGLILLGIPELHKNIRESFSEWKTIKQEVEKLFNWLGKKGSIATYSIEYAFLKALDHLEAKTKILDLELIEAKEIMGKSGSIKVSFETTELVYYLFIFKEDSERCFLVLIDSRLKIILSGVVGLDPRYRKEIEFDNNI